MCCNNQNECNICRVRDDDSGLYDNVQMLLFKGVIESLAFSKV